MLSYYLVDVGYATNMFFILTIMLSYKRSRKTLPIAFVLGLLMYVILDYICVFNIPGNVTFDSENIVSYATVMENMLMIARDFAMRAKRKWMYISFRQNGDMVLIKTEFSKEKKDKLFVSGNIFQKQTNSTQRLKLIKSISEVMSGTVNIVNKDNEGSIGVLLNNM